MGKHNTALLLPTVDLGMVLQVSKHPIVPRFCLVYCRERIVFGDVKSKYLGNWNVQWFAWLWHLECCQR
jgi:hypothetical protein